MELYLIGGCQKKRFVKPDDAEHRFESAVIVRLDTDSRCSEQLVSYKTNEEAKADSEASNLFTSGTLRDQKMYVCTYTEVLMFDVPTFVQVGYISLPRFNALHHVVPTRRGTLLVANTGLDMAVEITIQGEVLREWNVLSDDPWSRFSPGIDYRKVLSTKPHRSHPNFVFEIGEDVWVTRFSQKDAMCLTNPQQNIPLSLGFPHDGVLHRGRLYFTTVNGHLIEVNPDSPQVTKTWDLKALCGDSNIILGWCRGVAFAEANCVWVGFTRIRKSVALDNLNWIKHSFRKVDTPTHISLFDLAENRFLKKIDLESHGINILFSIHPSRDKSDD